MPVLTASPRSTTTSLSSLGHNTTRSISSGSHTRSTLPSSPLSLYGKSNGHSHMTYNGTGLRDIKSSSSSSSPSSSLTSNSYRSNSGSRSAYDLSSRHYNGLASSSSSQITNAYLSSKGLLPSSSITSSASSSSKHLDKTLNGSSYLLSKTLPSSSTSSSYLLSSSSTYRRPPIGSSVLSSSASRTASSAYGISSPPVSAVTLTRYNPRRSSLDYNDSGEDSESLSSVKSFTSTSSSSYLYSPVSRRRKYNLTDNQGFLSQLPGFICGLTNLGNTCYMNAVLQALYATSTLREFIIQNQRQPLMSALGQLFEAMESPENSAYSPSWFRSQFVQKQNRFKGSDQHDAQEFLRFLLNELHEEINEAKGRPKPSSNSGSPRSSSEAWSRYKTIDDSKFIDMLAGQLSSTIECATCGNKSTCWDPFWDLSLPLPRFSYESTVEQCLKEFTALEELSSGEMAVCEKCKVPTASTKRLSIEKAPSILILHLKRFSNEGYKLSSPKVIPNERLYVKSRCYSLYAIVTHVGSSARSGHYTAYCQHASKWYYFNDERVTEVKNFDSSTIEDSYILFYTDTSYTSRL